jgi:hypothetical protein
MKKVNLVLIFFAVTLFFSQSAIAQKKGTKKPIKTTKEAVKPTKTETTKPPVEVVKPVENKVVVANVPIDPVLMTINGENVTKSEFLAVYLKNNANKNAPIDEKSINEYLDLYINF